jgi:catechol 2,3-dioxygenase-like lactoylglutathione lyase family enzyme
VIRGINHVGISVSNLDRSVKFYQDNFGMTVVMQNAFGGEQFDRILGLRGVNGQAALLRVGDMQLELFEFFQPSPKHLDPQRPVSDHGISHFCIEVTDIEGEYRRLTEAGVSFHSPPIDFSGIAKATYGRDPDGNVFELRDTGGALGFKGAGDTRQP